MRDWCAAAHSYRAHFGPHPLDEFVYFALLSNAGDHAILFADMARNPRIFSIPG
ncbi:hypothetical protein BSLA_01r5433 [Burkholderia stabilis]|nr:hypothetical protein BSLA_01r5433 [Burkholderia stabilis]